MQILRTIKQIKDFKPSEPRILIPTMGALHDGHLSLVDAAQRFNKRQKNAYQILVSIFINQLQIETKDDFKRYPRNIKEDCQKLAAKNVTAVFIPTERTIYPKKQEFLVRTPHWSNQLEGTFRPLHFQGMATIVLKLFNITNPKVAVFGEKDCQQLLIIQEMIKELNLNIKIIKSPNIREKDGLALSSRNRLLTKNDRSRAVKLFETLLMIKNELKAGSRDFAQLEHRGKEHLSNCGWRVDYIAVRKKSNLQPASKDDCSLRILGAGRLGAVRLIDNLEVNLP